MKDLDPVDTNRVNLDQVDLEARVIEVNLTVEVSIRRMNSKENIKVNSVGKR
jgi:hypothetical protein